MEAAPRVEEEPARLPVLEDVFRRLIWAVDHGLHRRATLMAASGGETDAQRPLIRIAGRLPGISAAQLAAVVHVHSSTLTGVLSLSTQPRQRIQATREVLPILAVGLGVDSRRGEGEGKGGRRS